MPRLARAFAAPSRSALSFGSTVVDWLTLGVLGAATVALAISSRRAKAGGDEHLESQAAQKPPSERGDETPKAR